jgi:predicted dehydrogenase
LSLPLEDRPMLNLFGNSESEEKVRYAVVGLGWFAQASVLPAFKNAKENSVLAALVSGDVEKRDELSAQYGVEAYDYEGYESLLASGKIDAVYIVTPNSEHARFAIPAAQHKVHVLCEKPLAGTVEDARAITDACRNAGVKLMTAYRLHFEEGNLSVVDLVREGAIGDARVFDSVFTMQVRPDNVRLKSALHGGPLRDIGVYCINAARYVFQDEPYEATAIHLANADPRFAEVPEITAVTLRFPNDRLASFTCGFGESNVNYYRVVGTKADVRMEPGYSHDGPIVRYLTRDGATEETRFKARDQIGPEIVYFSKCVIENRPPEPSGVEGVIDLEIIEAIDQAAQERRPVSITTSSRLRRPTGDQELAKPKVSEPALVNAAPPKPE